MRLVLPVIVGLLMLAASAHAHNVGVEYRIRGEKIEIEAFFDDDTPAANAKVEIIDASKKEVAKGQTDARGLLTLPAPPSGTYQLVVNAGAGHRTTKKLMIPGRTAQAIPDAADPSETAAGLDSTEPKPIASGGDNREDFVRFPWGRVALGLGAVAVLAAVAKLAVGRKRPLK